MYVNVYICIYINIESASEPRGNKLKGLKYFNLKAKALTYLCHIRSTAVYRAALDTSAFGSQVSLICAAASQRCEAVPRRAQIPGS